MTEIKWTKFKDKKPDFAPIYAKGKDAIVVWSGTELCNKYKEGYDFSIPYDEWAYVPMPDVPVNKSVDNADVPELEEKHDFILHGTGLICRKCRCLQMHCENICYPLSDVPKETKLEKPKESGLLGAIKASDNISVDSFDPCIGKEENFKSNEIDLMALARQCVEAAIKENYEKPKESGLIDCIQDPEDPLFSMLKELRQMAVDLNKNIEIYKTLQSSQNLQNELFLERISNLEKRLPENDPDRIARFCVYDRKPKVGDIVYYCTPSRLMYCALVIQCNQYNCNIRIFYDGIGQDRHEYNCAYSKNPKAGHWSWPE